MKIDYPDGDSRIITTSEEGTFFFPKKERFHWGILFGVALNHSLPMDHYPNGYASIEIYSPGYMPSILIQELWWGTEKEELITGKVLQIKPEPGSKLIRYPEIPLETIPQVTDQ